MFRNNTQTRFWVIATLVFFGVLWLLKPMLLPFLVGLAIAYFLNPVVDRLARHKIPRWFCAVIVLAGFVIIISLLAILIAPLLQTQIGALVDAVPGYIEKVRTHLVPWFETWLSRFSPEDVEKVRNAAGQYVGDAAGLAGKALRNIITGSLAFIDVIALLFITPVVAFYMMRDWPKVTMALDAFIPRRHYEVVRAELTEIDATLSGFVRGQALVCLALGLIYALGLSACGLQYGAAIGVIAGVLSCIPYVGSIFAWVFSLILAITQFDNFGRICFVLTVLLFGHIMESYVLTPRLVGRRVGLHPVWILFALIAGAQLMGFSGVLIAVPMAAVIGVLTRFAIRQYKNSSLYKDPLAPSKP